MDIFLLSMVVNMNEYALSLTTTDTNNDDGGLTKQSIHIYQPFDKSTNRPTNQMTDEDSSKQHTYQHSVWHNNHERRTMIIDQVMWLLFYLYFESECLAALLACLLCQYAIRRLPACVFPFTPNNKTWFVHIHFGFITNDWRWTTPRQPRRLASDSINSPSNYLSHNEELTNYVPWLDVIYSV